MTASSVDLITREVMIQINPTTKPLRLLSLHALADAVSRDPVMFDIPHEKPCHTAVSVFHMNSHHFLHKSASRFLQPHFLGLQLSSAQTLNIARKSC